MIYVLSFIAFVLVALAVAIFSGVITITRHSNPKPRLAELLVHCQRRTEQDETMDFAITLFKDETDEQWQERLDKAWSMAERRMKVQNDRMIALMEEQQRANEKREEA